MTLENHCGAWPNTYQRFMPNYWFDALELADALARLRRTPGEVAQLLDGLPEAQLNQAPADGAWAIRNVLTHLRDAQDVLAFRLDLLIKEQRQFSPSSLAAISAGGSTPAQLAANRMASGSPSTR